jgi:ATP-dependent Clp protease ATP-binding subunit ClpA
MGARPLARVIQEKVKRPLAEEILFGKLTKGGLVTVDFAGGKLTFEFEEEEGGKAREKDEEDFQEEIAED